MDTLIVEDVDTDQTNRPKRNRYASLSVEQKERYIKNTNGVRKKRRATMDNSIVEEKNIDWTTGTSGKRKRVDGFSGLN